MLCVTTISSNLEKKRKRGTPQIYPSNPNFSTPHSQSHRISGSPSTSNQPEVSASADTEGEHFQTSQQSISRLTTNKNRSTQQLHCLHGLEYSPSVDRTYCTPTTQTSPRKSEKTKKTPLYSKNQENLRNQRSLSRGHSQESPQL